jgi:hypothetical protein
MIKTEQQIERDFYSFIKDSPLGKAIKGGIYRPGMRPANATTEDLIVKFLSGVDEQVQTGIVIINLYVPDVAYSTDGRKVKDDARIAELEELILSFVNDNADTEYWMKTDGSPTSMLNEDINQHFIYARIKFNRITAD